MRLRSLISVAVVFTAFAEETSAFVPTHYNHGLLTFGGARKPRCTGSAGDEHARSRNSLFCPSRNLLPFNSRTSLKMSLESGRKLATMGRIPWQKLLISKSQGRQIIAIIRSETHVLDLSVMLTLAFFSEKVGKYLYQSIFRRFRENVSYDESITKQVEVNLGQAAKLGLVCYTFDAFEIVLEVTGIKGKQTDISTLAAKLIYATWIALRARVYKRQFFEAAFEYASKLSPQSKKKRVGKVEIVDKITDFFLFGVLSFIWIDILQIKRGHALSSIFALSGAGTLALTLALQDLAKRVINGLAISTSEVFTVGDTIQLGDGTSGTVTNVGWLSTEIRGSDEIVTKIPNTQLSDIRVSNLSRVKLSQVKQNLCFKYDYLDDIPELVHEIKKEIPLSCDKVIIDGSRPFRVKWVGYRPDGLEVVVDCRLKVPLTSSAYHDARQDIMEAIARVVKRKGIKFSPPTALKLVSTGKDQERDLVI
ncbi:hypothetical protein HJC23_007439 [Cyclotella cryptica]|uniref:Mechanosensitive ion channel MscS domain-containing protein n=1 Tax=Cyclotella cryptica TaxID=29204 RepID=A0ABD3QJE9_9STRA|eukprot:CCRYP_005208-RB/>CCRYP_005208-RB protein AED:0.05 eAED:0.05 QI:238/1/1/1/1/1/4/620/477